MSPANPGIPIVGTGARTPLGLNAPATAAAARAGIAVIQEHPSVVDKDGEPLLVCRDAELPIELTGVERFLQLALPAALEALQPVLQTKVRVPSIRILVALPEGRVGLPSNLDEQFAQGFRERLKSTISIDSIACHPWGHAGGLHCLQLARSLVQSGESELCLVGGVDSYLEPETLQWLDRQDQVHSESTIWGFCPSEGAGFCLLASPELANRLRLPESIRLLSVGSALESNLIHTESVCLGEGLTKAFQASLAELPTGKKVDHTFCDMNGDPYRGNEYGFAMLRSTGCFAEGSDFDTPADCWGDVGAASGPLLLMLADVAARKRYAPGPLTFLWASSLGGQRAAALLQGATYKGDTARR